MRKGARRAHSPSGAWLISESYRTCASIWQCVWRPCSATREYLAAGTSTQFPPTRAQSTMNRSAKTTLDSYVVPCSHAPCPRNGSPMPRSTSAAGGREGERVEGGGSKGATRSCFLTHMHTHTIIHAFTHA